MIVTRLSDFKKIDLSNCQEVWVNGETYKVTLNTYWGDNKYDAYDKTGRCVVSGSFYDEIIERINNEH